jgi:hypothetical protein
LRLALLSLICALLLLQTRVLPPPAPGKLHHPSRCCGESGRHNPRRSLLSCPRCQLWPSTSQPSHKTTKAKLDFALLVP